MQALANKKQLFDKASLNPLSLSLSLYIRKRLIVSLKVAIKILINSAIVMLLLFGFVIGKAPKINGLDPGTPQRIELRYLRSAGQATQCKGTSLAPLALAKVRFLTPG
jgi:hypothetical protein